MLLLVCSSNKERFSFINNLGGLSGTNKYIRSNSHVSKGHCLGCGKKETIGIEQKEDLMNFNLEMHHAIKQSNLENGRKR